jgi:predicted nucleotidyltransferase
MRQLLDKMRSLAIRVCNEESVKPNVKGILLFGSVAKGNVHRESDIDVVVIKKGQDEPVRRNEHEREGIRVDMWEHSLSCYERLFQNNWDHSVMFTHSVFLNILQNCEILYDPDGRFGEYRQKALEWSWPQECKYYVEERLRRGLDTVRIVDGAFEKLASMKRLFLVKACVRLLELGKPVSIRNKDYYETFSESKNELSIKDFNRVFGRIPSREELPKLVKHTLSLFDEEVTGRGPWTELVDAQKYLSSGDLFLVALSLTNGAYYLGCRGLRNRGVRMQETGYLWPESEVELIEKSRENWPQFYELYQKMHNSKSWRAEEVDECFEHIFSEARSGTKMESSSTEQQ